MQFVFPENAVFHHPGLTLSMRGQQKKQRCYSNARKQRQTLKGREAGGVFVSFFYKRPDCRVAEDKLFDASMSRPIFKTTAMREPGRMVMHHDDVVRRNQEDCSVVDLLRFPK